MSELRGTAKNGRERIFAWKPCEVCDGSGWNLEAGRYCICTNGDAARIEGEWALMSTVPLGSGHRAHRVHCEVCEQDVNIEDAKYDHGYGGWFCEPCTDAQEAEVLATFRGGVMI